MARIVIVTLFVLASIYGYAQDSLRQSIVGTGIDRQEQRKVLIQIYADSINSIYHQNLPKFLYDDCFDYNMSLSNGFHSTSSSRWSVLEKVTNSNALEAILKSKHKSLRRKCSKYLNEETVRSSFSHKSYKQLVRKRLKEIKKE